jgi:molybdenum cofactor cytidylyltransferase
VIAAIVLAAGMSRRMGEPKMVLPWGQTTVIGHVVNVLAQPGIDEIVVVTGGAHDLVEAALQGSPARLVYNPRYKEEEMAYSLQTGLLALSEKVAASLVVLGDQPQIESEVVRDVLGAFELSKADLVIPSYRMRRGHPWLISRSLWQDLLNLPSGKTLRDLLNANADRIYYLEVKTPSILQDLDTPQDYQRQQPLPPHRR